jgi:small-conductance mechanosensitive channel
MSMQGNPLAQYFLWAPNWLVALVMVVVAFAMAVTVHALIQNLILRLWIARHPVVHALIRRTRGVTRYALILFLLSLVIPLLPLDPVATTLANKVFIAALILLIGWVVLLAANLSADHYVGRFQIGAPDDFLARKAVTQVEVLKRIVDALIIVVAIGFALMTFDSVRQLGLSLFASAGVVGIIAGVALRSVLANFFAGLQIALTQPIRIGDTVTVEGEFGNVEELSSSYVVIRLWDLRRLVVPLSYFIEKPFQNWTRSSSRILGTVFIHMDYTVPIETIRKRAREIVEASGFWDKQVFNVQVTDMKEAALEIRILVSAADSSKCWDLRCEVREKLIQFLRTEYPDALPRHPPAELVSATNGQRQPDGSAPAENSAFELG